MSTVTLVITGVGFEDPCPTVGPALLDGFENDGPGWQWLPVADFLVDDETVALSILRAEEDGEPVEWSILVTNSGTAEAAQFSDYEARVIAETMFSRMGPNLLRDALFEAADAFGRVVPAGETARRSRCSCSAAA